MKNAKPCIALFILILAQTIQVYGDWFTRNSPIANVNLYAVKFVQNTFVAVGQNGTILTSPDGQNWTNRLSGTTQTLRDIAVGTNHVVVVGDAGTTLTSTNLDTWELVNVPSPSNLLTVTYGQGEFVAAAQYVSKDGLQWSTNANPVLNPDSTCFGNNMFVGIISYHSFTSAYLLNASQPMVWSYRIFYPDFPTARAVAYGAGRFVAVGGDGDPRYISMQTSVSTDGVNWSGPQTIASGWYLVGINYGGGHFIALGITATGSVSKWALSSDGVSWSTGNLPAGPTVRGAAYGAGTIVIVGDGGTILQSDSDSSGVTLSIMPDLPRKLEIAGKPGRSYQLEFSDSLNSNLAWQSAATLVLSNSPSMWTDTNGGGAPQRFYRGILLP